MKIQKVRCLSGLTGWRCRLRDNYKNFEEFESIAAVRGLVWRLGYDGHADAQKAWDENPWIEGSVEPRDFRLVPDAACEILQDLAVLRVIAPKIPWAGAQNVVRNLIRKRQRWLNTYVFP